MSWIKYYWIRLVLSKIKHNRGDTGFILTVSFIGIYTKIVMQAMYGMFCVLVLSFACLLWCVAYVVTWTSCANASLMSANELVTVICLVGSVHLFLSYVDWSSLKNLKIALMLVDLGPEQDNNSRNTRFLQHGFRTDWAAGVSLWGEMERERRWISSMLLRCQCARWDQTVLASQRADEQPSSCL